MKKGDKKKDVHFCVDKILYDLIDEYAHKAKMNKSEFLRHCIIEHIRHVENIDKEE